MSHLHMRPRAAQVTKVFVEGSLLSLVAIVSAVIAATLVYAWFFT
jgi:hypothetical protein